MAQNTQRAQPVRASPTPASTSTTSPTTTPASSIARPGAGVLTAEPAAVPTNVTTAVTHTMTPTTMPDVGLRCVRAAASTTAIGTASTPTGCTTDSGASTRAIACSVEPPAASTSPSCQPGLRETSRRPRIDSVPEPRSGSAATARCCSTAAPAKKNAATTARAIDGSDWTSWVSVTPLPRRMPAGCPSLPGPPLRSGKARVTRR